MRFYLGQRFVPLQRQPHSSFTSTSPSVSTWFDFPARACEFWSSPPPTNHPSTCLVSLPPNILTLPTLLPLVAPINYSSFTPSDEMTRHAYNCRVRGDHVVEIHRQNGVEEMDISFKRTVRVPDSCDTFKLPPDLGNLPLFKTKDYAHALPASMVAKGGLFMPMHCKNFHQKF